MTHKKIFGVILLNTLLAGCATTNVPLAVTMSQGRPVMVPVANPATGGPVTPMKQVVITSIDPTVFAATQQTCTQLNQQFSTQLPYQVLNHMTFQTRVTANPLIPNSQAAICHIHWYSDDDTVMRNGLAPDFMVATLERLDWQNTPELQSYSADGPTAHRIVMTNGQYLAVVNYSLAPPAGACSNSKPLAACKYPKKKWLYHLDTQIITIVIPRLDRGI